MTELKGRYVQYFCGDKAQEMIDRQIRLSLNAIKVTFGMYIAKKILAHKNYTLSNTQWFELELLPGEKVPPVYESLV